MNLEVSDIDDDDDDDDNEERESINSDGLSVGDNNNKE